MNCIEYVKLDEVNPTAFLPLLNNQKIREHLVAHQLFDAKSVKAWLETKVEVDSSPGCKVRAIVVDKQLGVAYNLKTRNMKLQLSWVMIIGAWEEKIFNEIMAWAKDLGHKTVFIHFLYTRPEYKFLHKVSKNVYESRLLGSKFTTYELAVK